MYAWPDERNDLLPSDHDDQTISKRWSRARVACAVSKNGCLRRCMQATGLALRCAEIALAAVEERYKASQWLQVSYTPWYCLH